MPAASTVSPPARSVASPLKARVGYPGKKSSGRRKTSSSPSGSQTGAPVPSARSASAPKWSKWLCVSRIAAQVAPELGEREPDLGGVRPGIDHGGLGRAPVGADEVAVRPDLPERELVNGERQGG